MPPDSQRVTASLHPGQPTAETRVNALSTAGQMLVWSARRWVVATRLDEDARGALTYPYKQLGCQEAAEPFDECMTLLALAASHPIAIRCLCNKTLSQDEDTLLQVFRFAQTQDHNRLDAEAEQLISFRLKRLFIRRAQEYTQALSNIDLLLTPPVKLSLV